MRLLARSKLNDKGRAQLNKTRLDYAGDSRESLVMLGHLIKIPPHVRTPSERVAVA